MKGVFEVEMKDGSKKRFHYYAYAVDCFLKEYGFNFKIVDEKIIQLY